MASFSGTAKHGCNPGNDAWLWRKTRPGSACQARPRSSSAGDDNHDQGRVVSLTTSLQECTRQTRHLLPNETGKLAGRSDRAEGEKRRTFVYCLNVSMISGARYHRVATYSVMKPVSVPDGSAVFTDRANPKSQTFRSQLAFNKRFDGLRSRCMTSAECSALSARKVWYTKYCA
jgi:hypothetical protein